MTKPITYLSLLGLLIAGCAPWPNPSMQDYKETTLHGINTIPQVQELERILANLPTDHFITHFGFSEKPVTWNTQVFFAGRYVLTYQVAVEVDYQHNRIKAIAGEPKLYLEEVSEIYTAPNGNVGGTMAPGHIFGTNEWLKVVRATGDFSVIGIRLNTNSPVPRFDEYATIACGNADNAHL